jgi:hypothetical protein
MIPPTWHDASLIHDNGISLAKTSTYPHASSAIGCSAQEGRLFRHITINTRCGRDAVAGMGRSLAAERIAQDVVMAKLPELLSQDRDFW